MNFRKLLISTAIVAGGLLLASSAQAITLGFDDLSDVSPVSNGYGGLNWNNFWALDTATFGASGYLNGTISPDNVIFNAFANPASFASTNSTVNFDFNSLYLTGAWNNGLNITITGLDDGLIVHSATVLVSALTPTLFTFNWVGVDEIRFVSSGGVDAGLRGGGTHFALDNLTINAPVSAVPVPAALPLLLTGIAGAVGVSRRRKGKAKKAA